MLTTPARLALSGEARPHMTPLVADGTPCAACRITDVAAHVSLPGTTTIAWLPLCADCAESLAEELIDLSTRLHDLVQANRLGITR